MKNMTRYFSLCYFSMMMFMAVSVNAQSAQADSLIQILQNYNKLDVFKADLLYSIANKLYSENQEMSLSYAEELEQLIKDPGCIVPKDRTNWYLTDALTLKGKNQLRLKQKIAADSLFALSINISKLSGDAALNARVHLEIGKIFKSFGENEKALTYFEIVLPINVELNDKDGIVYILYEIGDSYFNMGEVLKANDYMQKAYEDSKELGDEEKIASSLNALGNIQNNLGNHPKALEHFLASLTINEKLNDVVKITENLNNMGVVYLMMEKPAKSREYNLRSLDLAKKSGSKMNMIYSLGNIGISYCIEENFEKALDNFTQSLMLSKEIGDKFNEAISLGSVARVYEDSGEYSLSMDYYSRAYLLNDSIDNRRGMVYNLIGLGDVSSFMGNTARAKVDLKKGLSLSRELGAQYVEKDALESLYVLYDKLNESDSALHYYKAFVTMKEEMLNSDRIEEVTRYEMKYTYDKKILEEELKSEIEISKQKNRKNIFLVIAVAIFLLAFGLLSRLRHMRKSKIIIEKERDRSESLLLNILPAEIAEELKAKGKADARDFDMVSILFTDFKGFTEASAKLSAHDLVAEINTCFKVFDSMMGKYNIEKIKTIGDSYMAAGGLPVPADESVKNTVLAALEMQAFITKRKADMDAKELPAFEMRVGIHTGPIVAGIVGVKKFQYDIWGDAVNTASRMESSGDVGKVNVSQATYELLKDDAQFIFEFRGKIEAKGKGEMEMWFVSVKNEE